MKSIRKNGKYFRAVATPNRKKLKEEEVLEEIIPINENFKLSLVDP